MLDLRVKTLFFDRQSVISAVERGKLRALNRIGSYIRLVARRSIRRRKGTSAPGKPPHSHVGLLREHIYYSYDPSSGTVVIGPARLTTKGEGVGGTVPEALEKGGTVRVMKKGKPEVVRIRPRPFMSPALEEGRKADKLAEFWKEVI